MIGVRKFREIFQTLTEPTEVVKATGKIERIGVWYPERRKETNEQSQG